MASSDELDIIPKPKTAWVVVWFDDEIPRSKAYDKESDAKIHLSDCEFRGLSASLHKIEHPGGE